MLDLWLRGEGMCFLLESLSIIGIVSSLLGAGDLL